MKMRWSSVASVCACLWAVSVVVVLGEPDTAAKTRIMKCCKYGEELAQPKENGSVVNCAASPREWRPFIFSTVLNNEVKEVPKNWDVIENARPQCQKPDDVVTYVPWSDYNPFILLDTGHAILDDGKGKLGAQFDPTEYCADSQALLVCAPRKNEANKAAAATMRPKVRRCCGEDAAFDENKKACVVQPESADAPVLLPNASSIVELVAGFPSCLETDNFRIVGSTKDAVVQPDGGLEVSGVVLAAEKFCIERIKELDGMAKVFTCREHAIQRPITNDNDIRFTMFAASLIISAIFLAATLAAGWLLPASHHVLHWRCQTHHVVCLMFGDILLAIIQLASRSLDGATCKAVAILTHFFFLAAFFWLNTMCFNIWWTFRDLRPASLEKGQETVRLRVYACYAWGGPLLVAGLAALLDHLPPQPHYTFLRPGFGEGQCWFHGKPEGLAYFYGPIGVLLFVNVVFFVATARELTCGLWKGEFVKSTTERAALGRVCMKLVIVMGVTWIADVISFIAGGEHSWWYFTDLFNALQGVFIFIVVGWQPQVRAGLKRLINRNPRANAGRQGNGLSTTSHGMPSMGDSVTQNPSTKTAPLETIC